MNWVCSISREAAKNIKKFPKDHQHQIYSALKEMETDPFAGDVVPIKSGVYEDAYRKRIGKYRIIFTPDTKKKVVTVITVVRRSDTTY